MNECRPYQSKVLTEPKDTLNCVSSLSSPSRLTIDDIKWIVCLRSAPGDFINWDFLTSPLSVQLGRSARQRRLTLTGQFIRPLIGQYYEWRTLIGWNWPRAVAIGQGHCCSKQSLKLSNCQPGRSLGPCEPWCSIHAVTVTLTLGTDLISHVVKKMTLNVFLFPLSDRK